VEGVVVARVVEANVTALDFRFEQLAHDGFRLVSYGLAAPRITARLRLTSGSF